MTNDSGRNVKISRHLLGCLNEIKPAIADIKKAKGLSMSNEKIVS
jgi:hypothetical protein